MLAADGCASSLSNPVCCFSAVLAPEGPRGVPVAVFGHTGFSMLICRCERATYAYIHASISISTQGRWTGATY